MSTPQIVGKRRALSASSVLEAIGRDLMQIKAEDRLTFADLGRVLGKSEDQAAKYCEGTAEMGVVAYVFARDQWNGRFTGTVDAMVQGERDQTCDRAKQSTILRATLAVSLMLEDDQISDEEIRGRRKELEAGRDAFSALLSRIGPRGARA